MRNQLNVYLCLLFLLLMLVLLTDLSYAETIDEKEIQKMRKDIISKAQNLIESDEFRKEYNLPKTEQNELRSVNMLVFISFSMPNNLLFEYIEEARKYNASLILRGLLKGNNGKYSIPLTLKKINEISNKGGNIIVHPKLFQIFDITRVPSIVKVNGNLNCLENGSLCEDGNLPSYDKIQGSVSIKYALEQFNDL